MQSLPRVANLFY